MNTLEEWNTDFEITHFFALFVSKDAAIVKHSHVYSMLSS